MTKDHATTKKAVYDVLEFSQNARDYPNYLILAFWSTQHSAFKKVLAELDPEEIHTILENAETVLRHGRTIQNTDKEFLPSPEILAARKGSQEKMLVYQRSEGLKRDNQDRWKRTQ